MPGSELLETKDCISSSINESFHEIILQCQITIPFVVPLYLRAAHRA